jgi:DNA-binding response OmpR family regulator
MTRLLVVEDDPAILRGLADNLSFESYDVVTASDGETAYRLIHDRTPDLVVLDLMLPNMSGYELCRKLRAEEIATPIVMLTARGEESTSVRTTTSRSRSRSVSCWLVSGPFCAARSRSAGCSTP